MEKQSLLEYENMQKFLQLLDENDMHEQKINVEFLARYVDQMENQFDCVLDELKNVRQELNAIQDKTLRATATRAIDKVVNKIDTAKGQLLQVKEQIKNTVDKAIGNFKEHGKSALSKAMKALNVKDALTNIKNGLDNAILSADKGIDNLSKFANEVHEVNSHFKNIGRMFIGKDIKDKIPRNPNKGMILKVQETLFFSMTVFTKMSKKTDNIIQSVKNLETIQVSKKSVKDDLKDIKDNKKSAVNKQEKSKENMQLGQR